MAIKQAATSWLINQKTNLCILLLNLHKWPAANRLPIRRRLEDQARHLVLVCRSAFIMKRAARVGVAGGRVVG